MNLSEAGYQLLDVFRGKKRDFQHTFNSQSGQRVLIDLAAFCRANETCFHADPRLHAVAEGRREVWLRIQKYLNLSSEDLMQLYQGKNPNLTNGDDNA